MGNKEMTAGLENGKIKAEQKWLFQSSVSRDNNLESRNRSVFVIICLILNT